MSKRAPRAGRPTRTSTSEAARTDDTTAIYVRLSLADTEADGSLSTAAVERQEEACRKLCEEHGWSVSRVYADNSISATSGKVRPGFEELLRDQPSRIVVWHQDRLVRKASDLERVIALDVPVVAATAGTLDLSTPTGRAVARTVVAWSSFEGEHKAERQRASHRQRAESGKAFVSHRVPFGFRVVEGELLHHPDQAPALRHCFDMVRTGSTYAEAARWLNAEGFTTTVGGRKWNGSNLARVMRHERNAGLLSYNDGEIQAVGNWEPIVPLDQWRAILDRAEVINAGRAAAPAGDHVRSLLGGIARCECGEKMKRTRQQSKRAGGEVVFAYVYQCVMHCTSIRADFLDDYVSKYVLRELPKPSRALQEGQPITSEEAEEAAAEAVRLRDKLEEIDDRYDRDDITAEQHSRLTAKTRAKLAAAEERSRSFYASPLDQAYSPAELIKAWKADKLTLSQRREAVTRYAPSIVVRKRLNRNERANESMVTIAEA